MTAPSSPAISSASRSTPPAGPRCGVPTLVTDGGKSPLWMRHGNKALAQALPDARHQTLAGQNHMLKPAAHAPVLTEFFNRRD